MFTATLSASCSARSLVLAFLTWSRRSWTLTRTTENTSKRSDNVRMNSMLAWLFFSWLFFSSHIPSDLDEKDNDDDEDGNVHADEHPAEEPVFLFSKVNSWEKL